jgi:capsular polysaccharide biosynthesis protein
MSQKKIVTNEKRNDNDKLSLKTHQNSTSGVTLGDLGRMITKHWKAVLAFTFASLACGLTYNYAIKKPEWKSSGSTIVIASTSDSVSQTNLNTSITLLPSLVAFINDNPVMSNVTYTINNMKTASGADKYSHTYEIDEIKKLVSASARTYTNLQKSLYIDVVATTIDKTLSKDLVNTTLAEAITLANDTSQAYSHVFADTLYISSQASDVVDSSMSVAKISLIALAVGLVLGILYAVIFDLCDTRISSVKDLENLTGYKNIGSIPKVISPKRKEDERPSTREQR